VITQYGRCLRPALPMNGANLRCLRLSVGIAIALAGCADRDPLPPPTTEKVAPAYKPKPEQESPAARQAAEAERLRESQIQAARQSDPALNWVSIGISTGKFSESIASSVYKTHEECVQHSYLSDNTCFPIAALPSSYWDARPPRSERTGA
jgi:predicted small lipoprotein YifL